MAKRYFRHSLGTDTIPAIISDGVTLTLPSKNSRPLKEKVICKVGGNDFDRIVADGEVGTEVTLIFTDVADEFGAIALGGNLRLSADFTYTADDVLKLVCDGTNFYELKRSVN